LVGALLILGQQYRFTDGALLAPGYTWSGLMAAVLGAANPTATILTSFFFSSLQIGGFSMERSLGLPAVITWILQSLIILYLAVRPAFFKRPDAMINMFTAQVIDLMTPVLLAALAGTLCERAGVFNIALEGKMLVGAFVAIAASIAFG